MVLKNRPDTPYHNAKHEAVLAGLRVCAKYTEVIAEELTSELDQLLQRPEYRHLDAKDVIDKTFDCGWPGDGPEDDNPVVRVADTVRAHYGLAPSLG
ncbi:hypothetical protein E1286_05325 [Nonomuraea terrae]|uniref:Uncharacterized protein n=1 Tax=Nonomuraea terrae TaxID=2530383 RepID=A0A4R4Z8I2_9ACTN|nr:hypothetical protein [Nonomuraea terrae]TDD54611.1 hypothetical protein E1286_05325 [Nonomuraea terrae]